MNFTFLSYLQNYKEFEAEILDLQLEKYWYQKMYYFRLSPGDENMIGIRSFECKIILKWKSVEVQPCTPLEIMLNGFCLQIIG